MSEDLGGCILFVIAVAILVGSLWFLGSRCYNYKEGYVQALADIESKRLPKYVRSRQENGEYIWVDTKSGAGQQSPDKPQE